ncbi:MAG TPA: PTS glucose transporter subunit IIA [Proteiniclasticum sp.]|nr:PTS glucose transporter subunit IIA [Proteiniclasticum sp.]
MKMKCELYMPVAGELIPLEEANNYLKDDLLGGTGVCIIPDGDIFFAPVSGEVVLVSDNLNAVAISTKEQLTILIHAGLDTAKLLGRGFATYVKVGDKVTVGDKLLYMDRDYVELEAKITTPIIITTPEKVKEMTINYEATGAFVKFAEISL